ENLWTELFLGNKKNLLSKIENFEKKLDLLKEFIQSDNISGLKEEFKNSTNRRERLDKK
ncbi:MAG: prephenate dehydrogenase dimerization domain-containing protein, partial [Fusobacteriaceae bacterium]